MKSRLDPDAEEAMPRRAMSAILGWTIVSDEVVDCRDVRGKVVSLRKPYVRDLPLYRAESANENGLYRVFHSKAHAQRYIDMFLLCDDYRIVPVRIDARPLTNRERKAERTAAKSARPGGGS